MGKAAEPGGGRGRGREKEQSVVGGWASWARAQLVGSSVWYQGVGALSSLVAGPLVTVGEA